MPFSAKSAAPCASGQAGSHRVCDEAARGGITLVTAPPGYLLGEDLAASVARRGRTPIWLRLGPEDRDPGTLLASLVDAARRCDRTLGAATAEWMRQGPGPVVGWSALFDRLARELAVAGTAAALVIENVHHLDQTHAALGLLVSRLVPMLPAAMPRILTSHRDLPAALLPPGAARCSAHDLRVDPTVALELIALEAPRLSDQATRRAAALCEGRAAAIAALHTAVVLLGARFVEGALRRAASLDDLLAALGGAWLDLLDPGAQRALGLGLRVGYANPALLHDALGGAPPGAAASGGAGPGGADPRMPSGPWLQALEGGWWRVRSLWRTPLRAALATRNLPGRATLRRAAERLAADGAIEQAVPLHLELGDPAHAAQAIAHAAEQLLDLGQWELLAEWLAQIPDRLLEREPSLLYYQAEIHAALGRAELAEDRFATAASLFGTRRDVDWACRSALAESALAARRHDIARAEARALAASAAAEEAGIGWHRIWAAWQLGALALESERLGDATTYFGRAAALATMAEHEPAMVELFTEAEALATRLRELQQEQERHRAAGAALENATRETQARLAALLDPSPERARALAARHGWAHTPVALKTPAPPVRREPVAPPIPRWWRRLRRRHAAGALPAGPAVALGVPAATNVAVAPGLQEPPRAARGAVPTLAVHLLGRLRVTLDGAPADEWPSGRSRSLFAYLLTHRRPWPSRETLMTVFWPDSSPGAARNSLHVAIHGLRRSLQAAADVPVVVFDAGGYRLHPDVALWLDVDEFERHVEAARRLEAGGDLSAASGEYELAAAMYQGDLLADDPYEEWPLLDRERLRVVFVDILDRLSQLYFGQQRYAPCATLCLRIIERDGCREDAHRRLMRCYERQDQPHLALRQYRACADTLRAELDVDPAPATTALYERIRAAGTA